MWHEHYHLVTKQDIILDIKQIVMMIKFFWIIFRLVWGVLRYQVWLFKNIIMFPAWKCFATHKYANILFSTFWKQMNQKFLDMHWKLTNYHSKTIEFVLIVITSQPMNKMSSTLDQVLVVTVFFICAEYNTNNRLLSDLFIFLVLNYTSHISKLNKSTQIVFQDSKGVQDFFQTL